MRSISHLLIPLVAATLVSGCGGALAGGGRDTSLLLAAYSTPKQAYEALIPLFERTPAGAGVTFTESYDSSGAQSRAVEAGLPADVVGLALEPDMTRLVAAGLVAPDWNRNAGRGFVADSVVVFVVRRGNPKDLRTWDDVVEPGIEVLTPNPFTSGGARWNLLAAYGAQLVLGRSADQAIDYLRRLLEHTAVQDKSARDALATFTSGKGDVLLTYESDAIAAQQAGEEIDYVVPEQTILVQSPVAATIDAPEAAAAFVRFLTTPEAQRVFARHGYRPVRPALAARLGFPAPPGLFTIDDLGGWPAVQNRFFDEDTGIVARIESDLETSAG